MEKAAGRFYIPPVADDRYLAIGGGRGAPRNDRILSSPSIAVTIVTPLHASLRAID